MSIREEPCRLGIPILDQSLGGGFSRGSIVLLEDEIGVDCNPILVQFLAEGLSSGEYGYILSTEHLYETYRQLLIPFGIDEIVVETKRLVFLDAFTAPFGSDKPGVVSARGPTNQIKDLFAPRAVIDQIRQSLMHVRTQHVRGVFDSLSSVMLVSDNLRGPISLLSQIISNNKSQRHNSMFTIHADVHDPKIIKALEHYSDGVLKLTFSSDGSPVLRIVKHEGMRPEKDEFLYTHEPGKVTLEPTK
ncbi:MAG TPA: RAD55 family ATPase [Candidatus Hodarchaeales archaeon]|nr:RAD55 family ATPase [Candidatus Hodarchaeales archaeon]